MSLADGLAELIDGRSVGGRLLVAVDGPAAAGKTTLETAWRVERHPYDTPARRTDNAPLGEPGPSTSVAAQPSAKPRLPPHLDFRCPVPT